MGRVLNVTNARPKVAKSRNVVIKGFSPFHTSTFLHHRSKIDLAHDTVNLKNTAVMESYSILFSLYDIVGRCVCFCTQNSFNLLSVDQKCYPPSCVNS
uniref:Uncharacterized protein n=1 Tax=Daphnia magna TaxID=35525 RepID=A0A0P6F2J0_9CRUS